MTRSVRISLTAREMFLTLLTQGAEKFGVAVAYQKHRIVIESIETYLVEHPHRGLIDRRYNFRFYSVSKTPFVVVYEYDDAELRVLFIMHSRADRRRLDLAEVEW